MEREWIARAKQGDQKAFEQLMRLYEKKVYSIALRMTGDAADAFDVSQDTFLRLYHTLNSYRGDSAFSTWLYRLTTNICLDHLRKRKRRRHYEMSLAEMSDRDQDALYADAPDSAHDPERVLEQSVLRGAIQDALDALSPDHRRILVMREIAGLSYAEIAAALELEPGTVKSRIARAREQTRETLLLSGNLPGRNGV